MVIEDLNKGIDLESKAILFSDLEHELENIINKSQKFPSFGEIHRENVDPVVDKIYDGLIRFFITHTPEIKKQQLGIKESTDKYLVGIFRNEENIQGNDFNYKKIAKDLNLTFNLVRLVPHYFAIRLNVSKNGHFVNPKDFYALIEKMCDSLSVNYSGDEPILEEEHTPETIMPTYKITIDNDKFFLKCFASEEDRAYETKTLEFLKNYIFKNDKKHRILVFNGQHDLKKEKCPIVMKCNTDLLSVKSNATNVKNGIGAPCPYLAFTKFNNGIDLADLIIEEYAYCDFSERIYPYVEGEIENEEEIKEIEEHLSKCDFCKIIQTGWSKIYKNKEEVFNRLEESLKHLRKLSEKERPERLAQSRRISKAGEKFEQLTGIEYLEITGEKTTYDSDEIKELFSEINDFVIKLHIDGYDKREELEKKLKEDETLKESEVEIKKVEKYENWVPVITKNHKFQEYLFENYVKFLDEYYEKNKALVHGDLHLKNIRKSKKELILFDTDRMHIGLPQEDLVKYSRLDKYGIEGNPVLEDYVEKYMDKLGEIENRDQYRKDFIKAYNHMFLIKKLYDTRELYEEYKSENASPTRKEKLKNIITKWKKQVLDHTKEHFNDELSKIKEILYVEYKI